MCTIRTGLGQQHVSTCFYHKYAKRLGLEEMLMGHFQTYNIVLVLSIQ
jgi:hypothetical protein